MTVGAVASAYFPTAGCRVVTVLGMQQVVDRHAQRLRDSRRGADAGVVIRVVLDAADGADAQTRGFGKRLLRDSCPLAVFPDQLHDGSIGQARPGVKDVLSDTSAPGGTSAPHYQTTRTCVTVRTVENYGKRLTEITTHLGINNSEFARRMSGATARGGDDESRKRYQSALRSVRRHKNTVIQPEYATMTRHAAALGITFSQLTGEEPLPTGDRLGLGNLPAMNNDASESQSPRSSQRDRSRLAKKRPSP